jgi:hypothetical protein
MISTDIFTAGEIFDNLKENQIAKAIFADTSWYIIRDAGTIRYCNRDGLEIQELVPLTYSNLRADYVIVGFCKR